MILVNSYGGSGTTLLIEQLRKFDVPLIFDGTSKTSEGKRFKHVKSPIPKDCFGFTYGNDHASIEKPMEITKVIYLYANPIDAIKTFWRKGLGSDGKPGHAPAAWAIGHCVNIFGDHEEIALDWDIGDYAAALTDHLSLIQHFCNWASLEKLRLSPNYKDLLSADYPVMYLKYERMWENLDKIRDFVGLPQAFVETFPEKRERQKFEIDKECYENLQQTYSKLIEMQNSWPDCVVRNEGIVINAVYQE